MSYRIVKIINEYEVVVNAGYNEGIKKDDILEVYIEGEIIEDPYNEKKLGRLDHIKAELLVNVVYENMCLCSNNKCNSYNILEGAISQFNKIEKKPLKINPKDITSFGTERDYVIRLGDKVRKSL